MQNDIIQEIYQALISGNRKKIDEAIHRALSKNVPPQTILKEGLLAAMDNVGKRFKAGELFVPEVLMCANAMHTGLSLLKSVLKTNEQRFGGKVLIGTVFGDIHDIGKNLVIIMLEGSGFQVVDLGINVLPEKFLDAAQKEQPQVIGMSSMITTTMGAMAETINLLASHLDHDKVKFIVGGASINQTFASQIGADGYGADAIEAVSLVRQLIQTLS